MTDTDERKLRRTESVTAPEPQRALAVVNWLRPLARAPAMVREIAGVVERVASVPARAIPAPLTKMPPVLLSFVLLVLAPAFAVTLYFAFIASNQYSVETRFAVRSIEVEPQTSGSSGETGGATGGFPSRPRDKTLIS